MCQLCALSVNGPRGERWVVRMVSGLPFAVQSLFAVQSQRPFDDDDDSADEGTVVDDHEQ